MILTISHAIYIAWLKCRDRETVWDTEIDRPRYVYTMVMSPLFGRLQTPVDPCVEKLISFPATHGWIRTTWLTWIVEAIERVDKRGILNGSPFPQNRLIVRTYLMQIKWWDEIEWGQCWWIEQIHVFKTKLHIHQKERRKKENEGDR